MSDKIYILDTSALLTFIEDEEGAENVESLLIEAEKGNITVYLSFISLTEVFYITKKERGEQEASERLGLIKSLALHIMESGEPLNIMAGALKADYRISLADAFIAALCQYHQGIIVHKDPEFEQLAPLMQELRLPYKKRS
ncbi:MAG: type II toxin-antitoxin system VapC family toxin [Desulfobacterales bacterium]